MAPEGKAAEQASKILVIGPPCGKIQEMITKVKAINDKYGPFEALLCLGDLFTPYDHEGVQLSADESALLDGTLQAPIPLYFAFPASTLHPRLQTIITEAHSSSSDAGDLAVKVSDSLFYLGKSAVSRLPSGLRIAVAGGCWDPTRWKDSVGKEISTVEESLHPYMTSSSIDKLLSHASFKEVDIPSTRLEEQEPPQSLAAARAQMAAKAAALQQQADDQAGGASKPPIDILLTTTWPTGITMFSDPAKLPHPTSRMWGAPATAQLARACRPKYHFSLAPGSCGLPNEESTLPIGIAGLDGTEDGKDLRQMGVYWEREPYENEAEGSNRSVTRFISLARLANAKKQRWFMALNLVPAEKMRSGHAKAPAGTTASPYSSGGYGGGGSLAKRKAGNDLISEEMESGPNFRWSGKTSRGGHRGKRNGANGLPSRPDGPLPEGPPRQRPTATPVGPQDCWFCLSNPQCAKHLIVAIGTECYVAMPKGQLPPTSDPLSPVPGGGHVLIVPIEHFPSLLGHDDPDFARPIAAEMQLWRSALAKAFAVFDARPVSWEVCKTIGSRAGHMQCQVVPVPGAMFDGIEDFFRQAAAKYEYTFVEDAEEVRHILRISDDAEARRRIGDYVRLDFDQKTWVMLLKDQRFNLQFPRETLAAFLNVPARADWKQCARSEAIETAEVKAFKSAFDDFSKDVA